MILSIFFVAAILIIWFETTAFVEYASLLRLNKLFKIDEYYKQEEEYTLFLAINYNNFFTRLLSCPYCIGFWMSIIFALTLSFIEYFPIIMICSLILYGTTKGLINYGD